MVCAETVAMAAIHAQKSRLYRAEVSLKTWKTADSSR